MLNSDFPYQATFESHVCLSSPSQFRVLMGEGVKLTPLFWPEDAPKSSTFAIQ